MIDILYPLGTGSTWENNELRYSLRSVQKHLKNYANVWIVGEHPDWITNVNVLPMQDKFHPSCNIKEKILRACRENSLSENFLFMNDDFFFLKDIDAPTYPYYHRGPLQNAIPKNQGNWYQEYVIETVNALTEKKLNTLNFDIHTPIIYNKESFVTIMNGFDFNNKLAVKSIYANALALEGIQIEDCKLKGHKSAAQVDQIIKDRHIFSTGDHCLTDTPTRPSAVKVLLEKLFPDKSKYEL